MSDKYEKFEVGDTVEVIDNYGGGAYTVGEVGIITHIRSDNYGSEHDLIYIEGRGSGMYPRRFRKVKPQTITLTHKSNGSKLTAVTTEKLTGEKIGAVIEGTTEPVVQFITADWDVEVVEPPFAFPTKRGAIVRLGGNGYYVRVTRGGGDSMRAWRNFGSGEVYSTDKLRNYEGFVVEFEGLDH